MTYRFSSYCFDTIEFRLTQDGVPVSLEPKVLRLLEYLLENPKRLVRKRELLEQVWQEENVSENALTRCVGVLRRALNENSREPRFIETVPTAGYRFIAEITMEPETVALGEGERPEPSPAEPAGRATAAAESTIVPSASRQVPRWLTERAPLALLTAMLLVFCGGWIAEQRLSAGRSIHSLAVLPLENLSGDPAQEYFADGMTDELITELARVPSLRVVSRSSVMQEKGKRRSLAQVANGLHVDAMVDGSVMRSGDRVRITARLVDTRSDEHLWAHTFEGPASDILQLEDTVAEEIAAHARVTLMGPVNARVVSPAAHDTYLRAIYFLNQRNASMSIRYFRETVALDPGYASAYAGLASALESAYLLGDARAENVGTEAMAAARKAIALDPENGEAYTALGSLEMTAAWDLTLAQRDLHHGVELNPGNSYGQMKYAIVLDALNQPNEAVTYMRRALALDPLSFLMNRHMGSTLYYARQYDEALIYLERAREMEPGRSDLVDNWESWVYEGKGMHTEAVEHDLAMIHAAWPNVGTEALQTAFQSAGWEAYWRARARAMEFLPGDYIAYERGMSLLHAEDKAQGFALLERAVGERLYWMQMIAVDARMDAFRGDPRYAKLTERISHWQQTRVPVARPSTAGY